jgi:hypothetical protein
MLDADLAELQSKPDMAEKGAGKTVWIDFNCLLCFNIGQLQNNFPKPLTL